jgi:hypothetical protein
MLSEPLAPATPAVKLIVVHSSYSNEWQGTAYGKHVLVDGMLNGWLVPSDTQRFAASYRPAGLIRAAQWATAVTVVIISMLPLLPWVGRRGGRLSTNASENRAQTMPSHGSRGGAKVAMSALRWLKVVRRRSKLPTTR